MTEIVVSAQGLFSIITECMVDCFISDYDWMIKNNLYTTESEQVRY